MPSFPSSPIVETIYLKRIQNPTNVGMMVQMSMSKLIITTRLLSSASNIDARGQYYYASFFTRPGIQVRGGRIDNIDDDQDIGVSKLVASFESKLLEIMHDVEMESEIEIQKILGFVETNDDYSIEGDIVVEDDELDKEGKKMDSTKSQTEIKRHEDDYIRKNARKQPNSLDESQIDGYAESSVERINVTGQTDQLKEATTNKLYLHDDGQSAKTMYIEQCDNEQSELFGSRFDDSNHPSDPSHLDKDNEDVTSKCVEKNDSDPVLKLNKKKQSKPKRKKNSALKSKNAAIRTTGNAEGDDEDSPPGNFGQLSPCIAKQKESRLKKGDLARYLRADLTRASVLLIATVLLNLLLQRLQRQMELQGA